jgi:hypothetical protein
VTLAVWFRLRAVPPGAWFRRWLFERESILNTLLYAGVEGYRVKLWMVDPRSSDYAGLYQWAGAASAARYARYITSVLRPLSVPGSVGFQVVPDVSLAAYLASVPRRDHRPAAVRALAGGRTENRADWGRALDSRPVASP